MKVYKYNTATSILVFGITLLVTGVFITVDLMSATRFVRGIVVEILMAGVVSNIYLSMGFTLDDEGITKKFGAKELTIKWVDVKYIRAIKSEQTFGLDTVQIDTDRCRTSVTSNVKDYDRLVAQAIAYCAGNEGVQIDPDLIGALRHEPEIIRLQDEKWGTDEAAEYTERKVRESREETGNKMVFKEGIWVTVIRFALPVFLAFMAIGGLVTGIIEGLELMVLGLVVLITGWAVISLGQESFTVDASGIVEKSGKYESRIYWDQIESVEERWCGRRKYRRKKIAIDAGHVTILVSKDIKDYKKLMAMVVIYYAKEKEPKIDPNVLRRLEHIPAVRRLQNENIQI